MLVPMVAVLTAGDHVPVKPFVDVVGKVGAVAPWHTDGTGLNIGVVCAVTVMGNVVVAVAHCPALGVKV